MQKKITGVGLIKHLGKFALIKNLKNVGAYISLLFTSDRHLWQLKKSKLWGLFWSYQLNSTANPAHFSQKLGQMG